MMINSDVNPILHYKQQQYNSNSNNNNFKK